MYIRENQSFLIIQWQRRWSKFHVFDKLEFVIYKWRFSAFTLFDSIMRWLADGIWNWDATPVVKCVASYFLAFDSASWDTRVLPFNQRIWMEPESWNQSKFYQGGIPWLLLESMFLVKALLPFWIRWHYVSQTLYNATHSSRYVCFGWLLRTLMNHNNSHGVHRSLPLSVLKKLQQEGFPVCINPYQMKKCDVEIHKTRLIKRCYQNCYICSGKVL